MEGSSGPTSGAVAARELLQPDGAHLALTWEVVSNQLEGGRCLSELSLENLGAHPLPPSGWAIYFNGVNPPEPGTTTAGARAEHVNGDLYRIVPTAEFAGLNPGDVWRVRYIGNAWAIQATDAPRGAFIVYGEGTPEAWASPLGDPKALPLVRPEQLTRGEDDAPLHDAAHAFRHNEARWLVPEPALCKITPTPQLFEVTPEELLLDAETVIVHAPQLLAEAQLLQASLVAVLGARLRLSPIPAAKALRLELDVDLRAPNGMPSREAYRIEVTGGGARIVGASAEAVFRGTQSLLQLLPTGAWREKGSVLRVPGCKAHDAPRYEYRGMHLDVARNFSSKTTVLRLLELMALYKLNRLHLHLSDDEGWRLEIRTLPELTQFGSRRGYSKTGEDCLPPSFGSGVACVAPGSGFYSREDFIELLRFAHARHIEVIPEIDVPGHARAAIKSMEARYRRFKAEGKFEEAERYLLTDFEDQSVYKSTQGYRDNVICVGLESCYNFVDAVVSEVKLMFTEAGAPLTAIHVGGDEMPTGCWARSPRCLAVMKYYGFSTLRGLHEYFYDRLRGILERHRLRLAGWEEIAILPTSETNGVVTPNPKFVAAGFIPYVWNNSIVSADGAAPEDLATRLANVGYPIVLCSASHLYLDFAYEKHPAEPGYYWAGYIDAQKMFELAPRAQLLGIQGQLWGENLRSALELELLLLPRLIVLAERAWAHKHGDWNEFANRLGQRELPRLDAFLSGFAYRVPVPGAVLKDGALHVNLCTPGFTLRYTTDGTDPVVTSPQYERPVAASQAKIAAFTSSGRRGRVVNAL